MSQAPDDEPAVGRCAQVACIWEATARKAGNVHRFADFQDLTYVDFVLSALAVGPALDQAPRRPVGATVLAAVQATQVLTRTNTNLGIVLLLAPLAKANPPAWRESVRDVLHELTVADARLAYEAIRLARPGGLGKVSAQDVAQEPTRTLREVMALAAERDRIARQYACDFADVFDVGLPALRAGWKQFGSVEAAVLHCQLAWLAAFPDSLIARKRGPAEAEEATRHARAVIAAGGISSAAGRQALAEFDGWLRAEGHSRNPGTTADLVTACLFVALRERTMSARLPFPCSLFDPPALRMPP